MSLASGERLGHYEIVSMIGQGGMGEVYRAHDIRLTRDVAIKVSSSRFSERFEREAKAIASLNHPNICHLYDVGPNYLVMELVDGPTLGELIKLGPIPLDEALSICQQMADALDAAHKKGITHRDLKPDNVKIKPDGLVKVLDFGLAKLGGTPTAPDENSPTVTMGPTKAGVILGTAAYMSPEQAKGKQVDQRSDIYAFGAVLYEMLTGNRLHRGQTAIEIMASVIKDKPQWDCVPAQARLLMRRCLEKEPDKRLRYIGDVMALVDDTAATSIASEPGDPRRATGSPGSQPAKTSWIWPTVAATLAIFAATTAWTLWLKPTAPSRATHLQITLPESLAIGGDLDTSGDLAVSPDGRKLVVEGIGPQDGLWIRDFGALEWYKLPGTEGARSPFWSPDSQSLAFAVGNDLKKIDVSGGSPHTVCTAPGSPVGSGAWNRDGIIVFGGYGSGSIRQVPAAGGVPTAVTIEDAQRGELFHRLPTFLPDGRHFLYARNGPAEVAGIYAASLDVKPSEQSRERLLANDRAVQYLDGNLVFMRDRTLMVQPFDTAKLQLRGDAREAFPVAERVKSVERVEAFSVSASGVVVYRGPLAGGFQPTWFDRQGNVTGTSSEPDEYWGLHLSPDVSRAAARDFTATARGDIWLLDLARGIRTRFTFHQSPGYFPIWSPDGSRIAFSAGSLMDSIYEKAASGVGAEKELLKQPGEPKLPTGWSSDGRFLLYHTPILWKTGADVWVLPVDRPEGVPRKPVLLLGTKFNEAYASFSPDGRWIAYTSDESGRYEVYVRPFVATDPLRPSLGEAKWQVSKEGYGGVAGPAQQAPKWRNDGKEIIFIGRNGSPMAVDVSANGSEFRAGIPKQLFNARSNVGWDVTNDGKRFLMLVSPARQNTQTPITVVLNWQADLKK
jgi:Tol biopolymer transport system component